MCSGEWIEMIDVRICYFTGGLEVSLAMDGHDVATVSSLRYLDVVSCSSAFPGARVGKTFLTK